HAAPPLAQPPHDQQQHRRRRLRHRAWRHQGRGRHRRRRHLARACRHRRRVPCRRAHHPPRVCQHPRPRAHWCRPRRLQRAPAAAGQGPRRHQFGRRPQEARVSVPGRAHEPPSNPTVCCTTCVPPRCTRAPCFVPSLQSKVSVSS
ncbi:uncharacterized protein RHOBADRAFT_66262, partial [Rhodotorula graminis WP1]